MNENAKNALAQAVALTRLAASSAHTALRLSDDRADWALADALYWAARADAQAARRLGDEASADSANELADDLVSLAEEVGHTIRR